MTHHLEKYGKLSALIVSCGIAVLLGSCAYGPKQKDKTFLESLNGEHYENGAVSPATGSLTPSIPIVKRRRANVLIRGNLILNQTPIPSPLANQELQLIRDSNVEATTRSDSGGAFLFVGDFSDGPAVIRVNSGKYSGERSIQILGFKIQGIDLYVNEK